MSFPSPADAGLAPGTGLSVVFLVCAVIALLVALRFVKRALAPIGAVFEAIVAAAVVAFALFAALALIGAALLGVR